MSETRRAPAAAPPARGAEPARPRLRLSLFVIAMAQLMVVLDATITNVALPTIQGALHFSGANLSWVVNAYALAFGGLLLLGGRAGDQFGRRRMFVVGLLVFSAASLAGGFATTATWLLAARVVQGAGGAIVAPAALALIATTFPEGKPRSRAMGVYAAMSVAGAAIGLVAGGLLVSYASWRWVLFVNVPIGVAVALIAPLVLAESPRRRGRLDLPGALTGTAGVAALVYALSSAAAGPSGTSHWGDATVLAALTGGAAALAAFALIESRSGHPLLPGRVVADRARLGANLIMLGVGTMQFGVFYFLALFTQEIWHYSPLRAGVAFLPLAGTVLVGAAAASALVARTGPRPLLLAGAAACAGGLAWLALLPVTVGYATGLLGPVLVTGVGLGLLFVPAPLVALAGVADADSGAAASLLNASRQLGGAIGLAVLSTVAWTVTGHAAGRAGFTRALAAGCDRAFAVAAAIALLTVLIALATIKGGRRAGPHLPPSA